MVKLPAQVKKAIDEGGIFSLATADDEGKPNVIYVGYLKAIDDETILVADNYFSKTKENLLKNPKISVLVRDESVENKRMGSYQIKGTAEYLTEGKFYDDVRNWCDKKHPRKGAVVIKAVEVYNGADLLS